MTTRARLVLWVAVTIALPASAAGQGYRARLDLQGAGASYRGVSMDSVLATQVIAGPGGGLQTSGGFAVNCPGFTPYCYFFRPGVAQQGGPVTATGDVTLWGLGVRGLSIHAMARAGADLGGSNIWPGTTPHLQLLEGFAEYASGWVTAQAGRMESFSRLGSIGYDGATVIARDRALGLEATAYGGLGLARAVAIPINSPVLNPLDQYEPSRRQWVAGAAVGWNGAFAAAKISYQREVDRRSQYFISERSGLEATIRPPIRGLTFSGGADYDLASAVLGTAEGSLNFARGPLAASVGARRYRPQFDLWTIWGAFSPVAYHEALANIRVTPVRGLSVSAHGEKYQYDPAGAETPLVDIEEGGWRWSVGADASPHRLIDVSAGYRRELGPGAASSGFDASATYHRSDDLSITLYGSALDRPLEFRFDDATVTLFGLRASLRPMPRVSVSVGASHTIENRNRPDAASFDWNQTRLDARMTILFGSSADRDRLPPATRTPRAP